MGPDLFATLTDAQIAGIYGHPRDSEGSLVEPKPAVETPKAPADLYLQACMELDMLAGAFGMSQAEYDEAKRQVDEKYGPKPGSPPTGI